MYLAKYLLPTVPTYYLILAEVIGQGLKIRFRMNDEGLHAYML